MELEDLLYLGFLFLWIFGGVIRKVVGKLAETPRGRAGEEQGGGSEAAEGHLTQEEILRQLERQDPDLARQLRENLGLGVETPAFAEPAAARVAEPMPRSRTQFHPPGPSAPGRRTSHRPREVVHPRPQGGRADPEIIRDAVILQSLLARRG